MRTKCNLRKKELNLEGTVSHKKEKEMVEKVKKSCFTCNMKPTVFLEVRCILFLGNSHVKTNNRNWLMVKFSKTVYGILKKFLINRVEVTVE